MLVRVQVNLPEEDPWEIQLPDLPADCYPINGSNHNNIKSPSYIARKKALDDWIWKHGKEQLLARMVFTPEIQINYFDSTSHHRQQQQQQQHQDDQDEEEEKKDGNYASNSSFHLFVTEADHDRDEQEESEHREDSFAMNSGESDAKIGDESSTALHEEEEEEEETMQEETTNNEQSTPTNLQSSTATSCHSASETEQPEDVEREEETMEEETANNEQSTQTNLLSSTATSCYSASETEQPEEVEGEEETMEEETANNEQSTQTNLQSSTATSCYSASEDEQPENEQQYQEQEDEEQHQQEQHEQHQSRRLKQRLDLMEKLQTVQNDFLDRLEQFDPSEEEGREEDDDDVENDEFAQDLPRTNFPSKRQNPADVALREMLDNVLEWSGCNCGIFASVGEEQIKEPAPPTTKHSLKGNLMVDISELDHSDNLDRSVKKTLPKIKSILASVNVPHFNEDENDEPHDDDDDDDSEEEEDLSESDDDSQDESGCRKPNLPLRPPQPITTYGPVHYKSIPGSVTLMMDQLRFEPVNPSDVIHQLDSDSESDSDDDDNDNDDNNNNINAASHEYNYMEVYWDKVEKYQLTPKSSTKHHLFKLIYRKGNNRKRTSQVILRMKSRAELERIAQDVKLRVVLPSKRNKNEKSSNSSNNNIKNKQDAKQKRRQKRRERQQKRMNSESSKSNNSDGSHVDSVLLSARERSVMLPPSLPRRMTSERNLLTRSFSGQGDRSPSYLPRIDRSSNSNDSNATPNSPSAPRRPTRRPTASTDLDLAFVSDFSDSDSGKDNHDSGGDDDDDDDDATNLHLWAVDDVLEKCLETKGPVTWKARKRDIRPESLFGGDNDDNDKDNDKREKAKPVALLPSEWSTLAVVPFFDPKNQKIQFILVVAIATDDESAKDDNVAIDFVSSEVLEWWVPAVKTLAKDILQQRENLRLMSAKSKIVRELEGKLRDSLRRHSDMIHGILPPLAISKLKVQPQQWKSPLTHLYQQMQPPKPSVVPVSAGLSVDDSSISGSVHSRYGLLVGGVPSLDSNSTIQTSLYGGTQTAESDYGLYSVAENHGDDGSDTKPNTPQRSNSTKTAQQKQQQQAQVPQRTSSAGTGGLAIRGLHRQGSVTNRVGTTRPIFSRMDSKRGMMMMRASSARGAALMRMDSAKRGNLIKMDSGRFGRSGIPRLNSLRNLRPAGVGANTSVGADTVSLNTLDQSWRTMYTDDESIHPEDLSENRSSTHNLSALSRDVSYLTSTANVKYINSSLLGNIKDVQALYAAKKSNVSILFVSVVNFHQMISTMKPSQIMDTLAKLLFTVDRLCEKHRTIKVETFGNTILIMSGLFVGDDNEQQGKLVENPGEIQYQRDKNAAVAALEMAKELVPEAQTIELPKNYYSSSFATSKKQETETLKVRVGVHVGDIMYGVLGQNVPKLNCLGDDMIIALRLEQTAQENCIRVSKAFRDLVGDNEDGWEASTTFVDVSPKISGDGTAVALNEFMSSASAPFDVVQNKKSSVSVEAFTLEPPPPALSGGYSESVASSFPSLSPWASTDNMLYSSDLDGGILGAQFEESFVSGEFFVD